MTLDEFVCLFAEGFDETPLDKFTPNTVFMDLDEWGSLVALSIIAMAMECFGKRITVDEIRHCATIEDLYNYLLKEN